MSERHCGRNFIDVLSAWTAGAGEHFHKIVLVESEPVNSSQKYGIKSHMALRRGRLSPIDATSQRSFHSAIISVVWGAASLAVDLH